ncbi:hypothetical protein BC939DRAFT_232104 [Gamsiella multidivaricata]|uniref:uncharacterized protein n=1 Tax=Gamsiella multidivaricata TaxID=101098 RepID=UPI002220D790|nr:uncharacterized protein BC939DRAFT_232104 [Gamsiella multidivaricata]KAI7820560.1 hypothetical protein BC939DRAFT_232104 [Gamsiella multidivaricata]
MDQAGHMWSPAPAPQPLSSTPSLRNVRLRFLLGPTNTDILRCADNVMQEYPVIIHQVDYRFDVYGRAKDVVDAIVDSFLITDQAEPMRPQGATESSDSSGVSAATFSPSGGSSDSTSTIQDAPQGATDLYTAQHAIPDDIDRQLGSDSEAMDMEQQGVKALAFYEKQAVINRRSNQSQKDIDPAAWKTDYHLEKERQARLTPQPHGDKRKPLIIILSLHERIAHSLLHLSGGLMSYLVEHQDLESCARQGMTLEYIKEVSQSAGMSVGISPDCLPRSNDILVWIEIRSKDAFRAVLEGVAWALSSEPIYTKERNMLGKDELELHQTWDAQLRQYKGPARNREDDDGWVTTQDKGKQKSDDENGWGDDWPRMSWTNLESPVAQTNSPTRSGHEDTENWITWDSHLASHSMSFGQGDASPDIELLTKVRARQHGQRANNSIRHGGRRKPFELHPPLDFADNTSPSIQNFFADETEVYEEPQTRHQDRRSSDRSAVPSLRSPPNNRASGRNHSNTWAHGRAGTQLDQSPGSSLASWHEFSRMTASLSSRSRSISPMRAVSSRSDTPNIWKQRDNEVETKAEQVRIAGEWVSPEKHPWFLEWQKEPLASVRNEKGDHSWSKNKSMRPRNLHLH